MLLVAGARPNFMKVAPVLRALEERGHDPLLVHTGQHYDLEMSEAFFRDLDIPEPDHHLGVGSASHAVQTARIMEAMEPVLEEAGADWLVVVGDVNSTLAAALVASKLRDESGTRIAHVEAGLRSGNWSMPEEVNRVLADRLSDLLLTPSRDAAGNLEAEGIEADRVAFVGNVMIDTLFQHLPRARERNVGGTLGLARGEYVAATLHRPANVDHQDRLAGALEALEAVGRHLDLPVVLPLHPRTRTRVEAFQLEAMLEPFRVIPPAGYLEMISLLDGAALALTDSGGIQEETTALGVPCVTLRQQTERPVTVTEGTNRLAPWPPTPESIREPVSRAVTGGRWEPGTRGPEGWDGQAARRIVEQLERHGPKREAID